jgi:hypothetical protein
MEGLDQFSIKTKAPRAVHDGALEETPAYKATGEKEIVRNVATGAHFEYTAKEQRLPDYVHEWPKPEPSAPELGSLREFREKTKG